MSSAKTVALEVRRELNRANLDISRLEVVSYHGVVSLYGWIGRARGDRSEMSVQERLEKVIERVKRLPGVRDVVLYCHIKEV